MERLRRRELAAIQECLLTLYAQHDLATFPAHVLHTLKQAVPADCLFYAELNLLTAQNTTLVEPADIDFPESSQVFASEYWHKHLAIPQK